MAGVGSWLKVIGTTLAGLKLGKGGVYLKNTAGNLSVRNTGDSADAAVTVSQANISGTTIVLNSNATEGGGTFKTSLMAPNSGMVSDLAWTLPPTTGTSGQVLMTDGAGNLSLGSAGNTALCDKTHSTSLAYGSTSPTNMEITGAADTINNIQIIIDTPFSGGTPSLSIGISGSTSKYAAATDIDLTASATTIFDLPPGLPAQGVEQLIATYSAGGCTAGAARIVTFISTPSNP